MCWSPNGSTVVLEYSEEQCTSNVIMVSVWELETRYWSTMNVHEFIKPHIQLCWPRIPINVCTFDTRGDF